MTGLSFSNGERLGYGKKAYNRIREALDMPKSNFIND